MLRPDKPACCHQRMHSMHISACKLISPHDQLQPHFGRRLTRCHQGAIALLYLYVQYKLFWVFIYHAFQFQISFSTFSFMYVPAHSTFYVTRKFSSAISWHYTAKFNVPVPVTSLATVRSSATLHSRWWEKWTSPRPYSASIDYILKMLYFGLFHCILLRYSCLSTARQQ